MKIIGFKTVKAILIATAMFITAILFSVPVFAANADVYGDVNSDGRVNAGDAVEVLKYVAGINKTISDKAADVNADGKITASDAVYILHRTAGIINEFPAEKNQTPSDNHAVLVAYFSATNTTEGAAETIADCVDGELYEITPEQPYTSADLNYNDDGSRSTIEMNDPNSRPAISGSVTDFEKYDIVFVGYPIWWGQAPRILSTFVESYDFSGKTVVPFCTSGGSGVGSSATNLEKLTSGATWLEGKRLNGNASESDISDWISGLGLNIGG